MSSVDYGNVCKICGGFHQVGMACSEGYIEHTTVYTHVKDDCPGRSQSKCKYCGKCHSIFDKCVAAPKEVYTEPIEPLTLDTLYTELGTSNWIGYKDSDWNEAIDAVRRYIRNNK